RVEAATEIGDLDLLFAVLLLGSFKRCFQCRKLAAESGYLLVKKFDLSERFIGDAFFIRQGTFKFCNARAGTFAFSHKCCKAALFGGRRGKRILQREDCCLQIRLFAALQSKLVHEFGNLAVQRIKRGVLVGDDLTEKDLRDNENGEQENEHKQQARQGINETRPVIRAWCAAPDASARQRHCLSSDCSECG